MLLLTYDPTVKQSPDYTISLTSPYGNGDNIRRMRGIFYKNVALVMLATLGEKKAIEALLEMGAA